MAYPFDPIRAALIELPHMLHPQQVWFHNYRVAYIGETFYRVHCHDLRTGRALISFDFTAHEDDPHPLTLRAEAVRTRLEKWLKEYVIEEMA